MASTSRLSLRGADRGGDDAPRRSPWRRPAFLASAIVVGVLVLLAVVLLLLPPADQGAAAPAPQPSAPPPTAAGPEPAGDQESVCGLEPATQTVPATPPAAEWVLVGTTAVPTDPDGAGPGAVTEDGFASCFSHDPTGALFAGINWWAQTLNGRAVQVYEEITAATAERDAALEQGLDESSGGVGQIAGYRFVDVDDNRALFELAFIAPQGQYFSVSTPMRWEDGDWKLVVPSTGDPSVSPLPDLTGFIPWSGVA